jgi:hypothetical protein
MRSLLRRPCRLDCRHETGVTSNGSDYVELIRALSNFGSLEEVYYYYYCTSLLAFECMARAKGVQESLGHGHWWIAATLWSLSTMNFTPIISCATPA